jgi:hypothetical protein
MAVAAGMIFRYISYTDKKHFFPASRDSFSGRPPERFEVFYGVFPFPARLAQVS